MNSSTLLVGVILALVGGSFIAIQGSINSMAGNAAGLWTVVVVPVAVQLAVITLATLTSTPLRQQLSSGISMGTIVAYLAVSAFLGLGIMTTLTLSFMKVGPLIGLSIVVFSQLLISMVIEHYGLLGTVQRTASVGRIAGLALVLAGVYLFIKK